MRSRRQVLLSLLAVLVAAGVVATDCFLCASRKPVEVEHGGLYALVRPVMLQSTLSSASATPAKQEVVPASISDLGTPSAASAELNDDTVVQIRELADADPAAVANAVFSQPVSALRDRMLLEALPLWAEREPAAAAEWIAARAPARELDLGLHAIVCRPGVVTKTPDTAFGFACEIVDPALRLGALRTVVQDWLNRDPSRMRTVLEQSRDLTSGDRTMLLGELDGLLASR